jgi:hypothetical protein
MNSFPVVDLCQLATGPRLFATFNVIRHVLGVLFGVNCFEVQ